MIAKATVNWIEKEYLVGTTEKGVTVPMESIPKQSAPVDDSLRDRSTNLRFEESVDRSTRREGVTPRGPTPKELVLHALAGCTMIDVVEIILKSRKHLEKCWVDVEAEVADEHPKIYKKIHLTYNFKSPDLDSKVAERAIQLSKEKYCSVTAMLSGKVAITHSYHIKK